VERRAARQYNAGHRLARRQCGERSREALLSGIAQGDRSGVRSALEQGADPNATGSQDEEGRYQPRNAGALYVKDNWTALMLAVAGGDRGIVEDLLTAGGAPNSHSDDGFTPLILSVDYKRLDLLRLLIARGADLNAQNEWGQTALIRTTLGNLDDNEDDLGLALIWSGADVSIRERFGGTALIWAARKNRPRLVKALLASGADVRVKDDFGDTALGWVSQRANPAWGETLSLLRDAAR